MRSGKSGGRSYGTMPGSAGDGARLRRGWGCPQRQAWGVPAATRREPEAPQTRAHVGAPARASSPPRSHERHGWSIERHHRRGSSVGRCGTIEGGRGKRRLASRAPHDNPALRGLRGSLVRRAGHGNRSRRRRRLDAGATLLLRREAPNGNGRSGVRWRARGGNRARRLRRRGRDRRRCGAARSCVLRWPRRAGVDRKIAKRVANRLQSGLSHQPRQVGDERRHDRLDLRACVHRAPSHVSGGGVNSGSSRRLPIDCRRCAGFTAAVARPRATGRLDVVPAGGSPSDSSMISNVPTPSWASSHAITSASNRRGGNASRGRRRRHHIRPCSLIHP